MTSLYRRLTYLDHLNHRQLCPPCCIFLVYLSFLFSLFFYGRMRAKSGYLWAYIMSLFARNVAMYWDWLKYSLGLGPYFILVSHCKYPVRCNPHREEQAKALLRWTADLDNQDEISPNLLIGNLSALAPLPIPLPMPYDFA
ncbi:hypothetical protein M378DRAFT_394857 [Amanita muscaria Koide BX008]|uniref:Uncharacterized protein n=1 Tax=Amanita muscaria (strain Koide BX008) TaxID=946122 RepID=A0A0C2WL02_AMAMK|nr:hypothetical protein M378DRAFT_394857 [Amanita muscaria Koide BX008]